MTRRNSIEHVPRCPPKLRCKICYPDPPVQTLITMFACSTCGRTIDPGKDVYSVDGKLQPFCASCPTPRGHQVEGGRKDDRDKARFDLIDPRFLEELAQVLTLGAEKYGDTNYRNVEDWRYVGAIGRHFNDWRQGRVLDAESGLSHLAHVVANCMFLYVNTLKKEQP